MTATKAKKGKSAAEISASKKRSAVLGLVEQRMRVLIERGISPTGRALTSGLGAIPPGSIKWARAKLVEGGLVRIPAGLREDEEAAAPPVSEPEARRVEAFGLDADDRPRRVARRVGRFRRLVREALRRERSFATWSRMKAASLAAGPRRGPKRKGGGS